MHLHQIEAEMDYLENQPRSRSICQLYEAMQRELRQCTTDAARDACWSKGASDIQAAAAKLTRKLNPLERVIVDNVK
jgi:hypothetical protein